MHRSTKATNISPAVKKKVFERDGYCVWCGSPYGLPESHYVPRSKLGLGIEENILTLCRECHRKFDGEDREKMQPILKEYLMSKYPDWDESKLVYRK